MESVIINNQRKYNTIVSLSKIKRMVGVLQILKMGINIKAIYKIIYVKVWVNTLGQMVTNMQVNSKMVRDMDMVL